MEEFLPPTAVTLAALARLLDAAGVDHDHAPDSAIYVTGVAFPVWVRPDSEQDGVQISTHWLFCDAVDEETALHFVNTLNCETLMVQFSLPDSGRALWGHYWLSSRHGLTSAQFLRTLHRFASTFSNAVTRGRRDEMLCGGIEPLPGSVH